MALLRKSKILNPLWIYRGSLYIDKKINGVVANGVQVYSLGENFNQKWWQFEVRLSGGQDDIWMQVAWKKYGGTVTKPSIFLLDDSNHGFLGFVTLSSRVGNYGGTFWDDIQISNTKVGGLL